MVSLAGIRQRGGVVTQAQNHQRLRQDCSGSTIPTVGGPGGVCDYSSILIALQSRRWAKGWMAHCPFPERHANGDRKESLSLWIGNRGQLMVKCHGCEARWREVAAALGVDDQEFFPDPRRRSGQQPGSRPVREVERYYDYRDEDGVLLYQHIRYKPYHHRQTDGSLKLMKPWGFRRPVRESDGSGGWAYDINGCRMVPYFLPQLLERPDDPTVVVEGERDAETLMDLGILATTGPHGGDNWPWELGSFFAGRQAAVVADHDPVGVRRVWHTAASLLWGGARSVRIVEAMPGVAPGGDTTDWALAEADRSPEALRGAFNRVLGAAKILRVSPGVMS